MAFTSRDFDATEARSLGFTSKIVQGGREEVLRDALELAKTIATKSPVAVIGTKRLLLHSRDHRYVFVFGYDVILKLGNGIMSIVSIKIWNIQLRGTLLRYNQM